jgi:hypothetical protein
MAESQAQTQPEAELISQGAEGVSYCPRLHFAAF